MLYRSFIVPAVDAESGDADSQTLRDAIAEFESGEAHRWRDQVPASEAPSQRTAWSGTYDLAENPSGFTALSFDLEPSAAVVAGSEGVPDVILTVHVAEAEIDLAATYDGEWAVVDTGIGNVVTRAGWGEAADLKFIFGGLGTGWRRELLVRFGPDGITVTETDEENQTSRYTGTRRE
jgi:hypothetical protein